MANNFLALCITGDVQPAEVDNYIDTWHGSTSDLTLADYLGFNHAEYLAFMHNEKAVIDIVEQRRKQSLPAS